MRNREGSIGLGFSPFIKDKKELALAEKTHYNNTNHIQKNAQPKFQTTQIFYQTL